MPKSRKPNPSPQQLLVEGNDDLHVISAMCKKYGIPHNFTIKDESGIENVLKTIPLLLKSEEVITLGIVVDADQDLSKRWRDICDKLSQIGYENIPQNPPQEGWTYQQNELPKIGVWLMPNNQLLGMLEDLVISLIEPNDLLFSKAETVLKEIEEHDLNLYKPIHHQKALIHTWLAWQKQPGRPMGQAITYHYLNHDSEISQAFINWLSKLFE